MKPTWPRIDPARLGDTPGVFRVIAKALLEIERMLRNGSTFADNMNAAIVTFDAQTAVQTLVRNPLSSPPIGMIPLKAMEIPAIGGTEDGTALKISTAPQLDDTRSDGRIGITVDFLAGTYGRVTGILVGG